MIRLVAGDVQLLELLDPGRDPHGRSSKPGWELARALGLDVRTAERRLRQLEHKGAVERTWRGQAAWWGLAEDGRQALEHARVIAAAARRSSPGAV